MKNSITAPPSAPVGVEEAAEDAAAIDKAWDRFNAALAQQPAACDMGALCIGCEPRNADGTCPDQQPAAVDGAMSPQVAKDWLLDLMGDHDFTLPTEAFDELVGALAKQPAAETKISKEVMYFRKEMLQRCRNYAAGMVEIGADPADLEEALAPLLAAQPGGSDNGR